MDLPRVIKMPCTLMGDKAKGGYVHIHHNDTYQVTRVLECEARGQPHTVHWYCEALPERQFDSFDELRQAWPGDWYPDLLR